MSQDRLQTGGLSTTAQPAPTYQAPDVGSTLARASKAMSKIRVVHGANEQYFESLEGKTVGVVRKSLREAFRIPGDAEAQIAGKPVGDDFVLTAGQTLEFVKEAGEKG